MHGVAISRQADQLLNGIVSRTGGQIFTANDAVATNSITEAFKSLAQENTGTLFCKFLIINAFFSHLYQLD